MTYQFMINNINIEVVKANSGMLFQNLVYSILKEKIRHTAFTIHYWRSTNQAEVDFVISSGLKIIPVEVKGKKLKKDEIGRSLYSFCEKYLVPVTYIVNFNYKSEIIKNNCRFVFLPFWEINEIKI